MKNYFSWVAIKFLIYGAAIVLIYLMGENDGFQSGWKTAIKWADECRIPGFRHD